MRIFNSWRRKLVGLTLVGLAIIAPVAYAAVTFGPDRPTFTWNNPPEFITFNSITDNPVWGDERYLVKARDASGGSYTNNFQVKENQEILVTTYFHNDAAIHKGLIARNTTAKVTLPTSTATSLEAKSSITADFANPREVWATMDFTGSKPFKLEYIPGSARLITNYVNMQLSDNVVGAGTLIGTYGADGSVPGCAQFSGYVTVKVRVKMEQPPAPVYRCDSLTLTAPVNRKVSATVTYTAQNGATFKHTNFDWGDGTTAQTVNGTTADHTYTKDGTYTVKSTVYFTVNGQEVSHTSEACTKSVTITTPVAQPTPQPQPPAEIHKAGAGNVLGLFAGVSAAGSVGHYLFRRFRA